MTGNLIPHLAGRLLRPLTRGIAQTLRDLLRTDAYCGPCPNRPPSLPPKPKAK